MGKLRYYIAALRWLWVNQKWRNSRQKWKAFDREINQQKGR